MRNTMFRPASYYRAADLFLHGNPKDPRIDTTWKEAASCFDRAISLLDIPGQHFEVDAGEFQVPGSSIARLPLEQLLYPPSGYMQTSGKQGLAVEYR
jgi:hypothetical protein